MATKQRKGTKSAKRKTTRAAEAPAAETPQAVPKLIAELAAMQLAPKMIAKLEVLTEGQQETVLSYVNQGQRVDAAYKRVVGANAVATPEATVETPPAPAGATSVPTPEPTKPAATTKTRKTKAADDSKRLSAIDAAAKVLGEESESMNCKKLIEEMGTRGYWTSPGGKTPHSTLYSAILREIDVKGDKARFKKTERGQFAYNAAAE